VSRLASFGLASFDGLETLEANIGVHFDDRNILLRSLAHRSWCAENGEPESNERLEFLGDSVLGLVVTHYVFEHFPDLPEGQLSEVRAGVVNAHVLAELATELDLGAHLLLGKGEDAAGGRAKQSILADAFEAVVAAVYLDGGFDSAQLMVNRLLAQRIETVEFKGFYDFKTRLQETSQARLKATPTYHVVQELGPDHDKRFVVSVTIGEDEWARAVGKSKKEAEQMAAAEAHFRLEGSNVGIRPKKK
jgi:ribonuclease III